MFRFATIVPKLTGTRRNSPKQLGRLSLSLSMRFLMRASNQTIDCRASIRPAIPRFSLATLVD
jgi:hypothetical protein